MAKFCQALNLLKLREWIQKPEKSMKTTLNLCLIFLAIALAVGCSATKKTTAVQHPLDGTWIPVSQEMGGKPFPQAMFATQKLVLQDTNYTMVAESVDKGVTRLSEGGKMDIYGREGVNTGKHFSAIYKLEADQLTVCYNLMGDSYPAEFATAGKPLYFMSVFKREGK